MAERSLVEILKNMVSNTQELIKAELRLAKADISAEVASRWNHALNHLVKPALKPARLLLMGLVIAIFAVAYLLLAAFYGLSLVVPAWAAAAIIAAVLALIASAVLSAALRQLRLVIGE